MSEQKRSKSGGNQAISRHPLFPVIVALWCGALLGAASIVVPPALIERAVTAVGIDQVLPMAAPPLGNTARLLIALVMTGLGGVIGAGIARRLAPQEPQSHHRRRGEGHAPAGEPAQDETPALAARRRGFGGASHASEADIPLVRSQDAAPGKHILNVAEFELGAFDEVEDHDAGQPAVLDGPGLDEPAAVEASGSNLFETYARGIATPDGSASPAPFAAPAFDLLPHENGETESIGAAATIPSGTEERDASECSAVSAVTEPVATEPAAPFERRAIGHIAAERIASAQLDELSPIELLERLALAMEQRRENARTAAITQAQLTMLAQPDPEIAFEPEREPQMDAGEELQAEPDAAEIAAPPFEPLPFSSPRLEALPRDPAAEAIVEDAPEAEPAADSGMPGIPAALRPVRFGDLAEAEDDALPVYIPPRHISRTLPLSAAPSEMTCAGELQHEEDETDDEESGVLDEGYSSLLDLSRPFAARENPIQQFIGEPEDLTEADHEPVAMFPAEPFRANGPFAAPAPEADEYENPQAAAHGPRMFDGPQPAAPEDTEQALRDALAALQRMSGAA